MHRGRLGVVAFAGFLFMAFAVMAVCPTGDVELRVTPVTGKTPLLVLPLKPGERFTLHYIHSVEQAPIWEVHSVDAAGRIFVEEERYRKFGAGMGKMPGVGRYEMRGDVEVITDMHMPVGNFVLRVGSPGVDHTVIWRGTRTNLSARVPHRAVRFSARPVNWGHRIWRWLNPRLALPPIAAETDTRF